MFVAGNSFFGLIDRQIRFENVFPDIFDVSARVLACKLSIFACHVAFLAVSRVFQCVSPHFYVVRSHFCV